MKQKEKVASGQRAQDKIYKFIYTIDNMTCQISITARSIESAINLILEMIPSATNITIINNEI